MPHAGDALGSFHRLLVIGLDGATYDALVPLAELGVMPHVAHLLKSSALATCRSTQPCMTPVAWTTFLTGADPVAHGILDFRYLDHSRGVLALNDRRRIGLPTLLDAVIADGGEVISLNVPLSGPAHASGRSIIVGGIESPSIDAALAHLQQFASALRASGASYDIRPIWRGAPRDDAETARLSALTAARFQASITATRLADASCDWRLCIVQFQELDALQHRAWHLLGLDEASPEGATAADGFVRPNHRRAGVSAVQGALAALDRCIGELMELAQRRGATVALVSDHGFGPFRGKISLPVLLEQGGLLKRSGLWQRSRQAISRAGLNLRKWRLRRSGEAHGSATMPRPMVSVAPIDWRRSEAVSLHGDLAAHVYLNRPERFGGGPLTSRRLVDQAAARVISTLSAARHPETGERLFVDLFRVDEAWDCEPIERNWPDIIGIPADGFHVRTKFAAGQPVVSLDAQLTGTHRPQGVFLLNGPGVAPGAWGSCSLKDLAPTFLQGLNVPTPPSMTGQVVTSGPSPQGICAFVKSQNAAAAGPAPAPAQPRQPGPSKDEQALVEARLRALGYLD